MSHMDEIFLTPLLPYREFLVTHGHHNAELMQGGKLGKHYHARYEFRCGTEVTVISGPLFYCRPDAPYEYRIGEDEPVGHQTDEELYILLTKIVAGEIRRTNEPPSRHKGWEADEDAHRDPVLEDDHAHHDDFHRQAVDEAHLSKKVTQGP
jgi:hypothetical protein